MPRDHLAIMTFHNGGIVVHGARFQQYRLRFSAWYDSAGQLLDAEGYDGRDRPRPVRPGQPAWQALESRACMYLNWSRFHPHTRSAS